MDRLKILLVDDETDFLETMGAIIEGWGYDLIKATNGKEAIDILTHNNPDIIVLDYMMPEMDGIEILKEMRKIDTKVPAIILTAYPDMKSLKGAGELGVSCYTPKLSDNFDMQASLKSAIEMVINQIRRRGMDKLKILLVDDEKDFLEVMSLMIREWGYDLIMASNGKEAIDAVMSKNPDIVILDYVMPDMNGVEVLREIRGINREIPVIMFTAHPDEKSLKDTKELGVSFYIPKVSACQDAQMSLKSAIEMIKKKL